MIPLEVELSENLLLDKRFTNLDIFKKTKEITYYAKCSYSMDFSTLRNTDIILDQNKKVIILSVPHPEIYSITIDEKKTVYSEPQLGLLRFGDISITSEEYGKVRDKLQPIFKDKMNNESLRQQALNNATLSLEKLISDLTGESYTINIKIKDT